MEFKNYTGDLLTLLCSGREVILPSDGYAEVAIENYSIGELYLTNDGSAVGVPSYAPRAARGPDGNPEVTGLPPDRPGVVYIVHREVAETLKDHRGDLMYPYITVPTRTRGRITCRGLAFPTK